MSQDVPHLSTPEIGDELARIHGGKPHAMLDTVIFGSTQPAEVIVRLGNRDQIFRVIPATCELALRDALANRGDTPVAAVIDFGVDLPLDISCRVAQMRVHTPDRAQRLVSRLVDLEPGQRIDASAPLLRSALGKAILSGIPVRQRKATWPLIGVGDAWRAVLAETAGLPLDTTLTFDRVLEHVATTQKPATLTAILDANKDRRSEFDVWFTGEVGAPALQAWKAWERGDGGKVAAVAVLLRAARDHYASNPFLQGWLTLPLKSAGVSIDGEKDVTIWADAGQSLLVRLDTSGNTWQVQQLIDAASEMASEEVVREQLADSNWLPFAFEIQKRRLAKALTDAGATESAQAQKDAREALKALRAHRLANHHANAGLLARGEAAIRLLACLTRAEVSRPVGWEAVASYASEYAQEGGYVDRARRALRGENGTDELGDAMQDVLRRADKARDALDLAFARSLAAWANAGRPAAGVLPIEMVLERMAAQFLDQGPERKLLVLVLDGLSWTVACELLEGWVSREISPVRWNPDGFAAGTLVPVLAALPTATDVSRAALFAGKRMQSGVTHYTAGDTDRFAHHPGLCRHVTRAGGPTLLLRAKLEGSATAISPEALRLLQSADRVVACVVNAIDDDLSGTTQAKLSYGPDDVPLVRELLSQAFAAGRHVLLTSDHGHVPGARLKYRATTNNKGARWRQIAPGEQPAADEIALTGDCVWLPPGAERVALLASETARFSTSALAGEHGGASLAEVVIPAVILGNSELDRQFRDTDPALEQIPLRQPTWWQLEGWVEEAPVKPAKTAPAPTKKNVMALPGLVDVAPPVTDPAKKPSHVRQLILESKLFDSLTAYQRDQMQTRVLPWLEAIEGAGGQMSADRFGQAAGLLPTRVGGAVSLMQESISMDGYEPVTFDATTRELKLHMDLLKQLWGG